MQTSFVISTAHIQLTWPLTLVTLSGPSENLATLSLSLGLKKVCCVALASEVEGPGLVNICLYFLLVDICLYLFFVIGQYFLVFVGGVAMATEVDGLSQVTQHRYMFVFVIGWYLFVLVTSCCFY